MEKRPNILIILCDDMGYSDIGCYGGEMDTPNIDRLAENGLKFAGFYNTPRCSPSRASLLTGLHPHQTGMGHLAMTFGEGGYPSQLNRSCVTLAEVLKESGYRSYLSGKWHLDKEKIKPGDSWPIQRGFDEFYGIIKGGGNYFKPKTLTRGNDNIENEPGEGYYFTDAIAENACRYIKEHVENYGDRPFFEYAAFTAPHFPLHAFEEDIAKYKGRFDKGWDELRKERYERMIKLGLVKPSWELTPRDQEVPAWEDAEEKELHLRRMEVYAAQIDRLDRGVGKIIDTLEETGQLDNTVVIFLSDNGASAEELEENRIFPRRMPGAGDTRQSYGKAWANLSDTPYRLYKHYTHEGGISTPFIIHWPEKITNGGGLRFSPAQLTDIMPTILEITGAHYPESYKGSPILPFEGKSLVPVIEDDSNDRGYLFWEHEGNGAIMDRKWKLVRLFKCEWELYDMENDRTEMHDLAALHPNIVKEMSEAYTVWEKRAAVIQWGTFKSNM